MWALAVWRRWGFYCLAARLAIVGISLLHFLGPSPVVALRWAILTSIVGWIAVEFVQHFVLHHILFSSNKYFVLAVQLFPANAERHVTKSGGAPYTLRDFDEEEQNLLRDIAVVEGKTIEARAMSDFAKRIIESG